MKRKTYFISAILIVIAFSSLSYKSNQPLTVTTDIDSLRQLYSRPVSEWPKPTIDSGAQWSEMGAIPPDTSWSHVNSDPVTRLGMYLFFDPRLSRSNQISCSSCHDPDMGWQDGRVVALGNDHLQGTRNTPSLLNVYIFPELFWDGRASGLESQMIEPLSAHHEMDMDIALLPEKLQQIAGYDTLFENAFGDKRRTFGRISKSIAAFQLIIRSRTTKFDLFMRGQYNKFSDDEIAGLHIFRNKAGCMNCHNGVYLTDLSYHNIGLTYYKRKYEDLGRYNFTRKAEDVGKFRTPSLRELNNTGPWMHNGLFGSLEGIVNMYNSGMPQKPKTEELKNDPLYPKTDPLIKKLNLTETEKTQLVAFLNTLSGVPFRMRRPELPK